MNLKSLGKAAERRGKNLLRQTLVRLLPRVEGGGQTRASSAIENSNAVRRVLAVRHDARLGNLLLLTPALRLIKSAFPKARVDALISGRYGDALAFNPDVDRVLSPRALPKIFLAGGYDVAFDFSPQHAFSLSSATWTALSRAKTRAGFNRGEAAAFLNVPIPIPTERAHETANLCALVKALAPWAAVPSGEDLRPRWHFGPGELERGAKLWRNLGLDSQSLAFFLGGRAEKLLPLEWFLDFARRASASGRKAVLLGGPAEAKLLTDAKIPQGVLVAPPLDLRDFAAFLTNARAVVSADTGPMHLTAALSRPSLAVFTHTEPWLSGCRVLESPGRAPQTDDAWSALQDLLQSKSGGSL